MQNGLLFINYNKLEFRAKQKQAINKSKALGPLFYTSAEMLGRS